MTREIKFHLEEIRKAYDRLGNDNKEGCYTALSVIREYKNKIISEIEKVEDNLIDRVNGKYYVGKLLVAKEDCMNNFKEAQVVEITKITNDSLVLDGVAEVHVELVDKYFK